MGNRITIDDLLQQLEVAGTEKVKLAMTDIDGILRGKVIGFDKFKSIAAKGFGFCDVVFGWDAGDQAYDNGAFTGWHTGYPDAIAVVDVDTMRRVRWEDGLHFFLADFQTGPGAALPVCPRGVLKRVVQEAAAQGY